MQVRFGKWPGAAGAELTIQRGFREARNPVGHLKFGVECASPFAVLRDQPLLPSIYFGNKGKSPA